MVRGAPHVCVSLSLSHQKEEMKVELTKDWKNKRGADLIDRPCSGTKWSHLWERSIINVAFPYCSKELSTWLALHLSFDLWTLLLCRRHRKDQKKERAWGGTTTRPSFLRLTLWRSLGKFPETTTTKEKKRRLCGWKEFPAMRVSEWGRSPTSGMDGPNGIRSPANRLWEEEERMRERDCRIR